jgi:hypothetical protein
MTKSRVINMILSVALFSAGVTLAQEPALNVDKKRHPNLAEAEQLVIQANKYIATAQKDNRYDMHSHASKARQLLVQVNEELQLAAEDANSADASQQKKK